jgi:rhodanese-related sulfurtransferase
MNPDKILLAALAAFLAWKAFTWLRVRKQLPALIDQNAQVIDVRSPQEFAGGHAAGSINIPLQELNARMGEIDRQRAVVVCCASGTRSGMAKRMLEQNGFATVFNAGSWRQI